MDNWKEKLEKLFNDMEHFITPRDESKFKQFISDLLVDEYKKGFNDGADATGKIAEETNADEINKAQAEERKRIGKEIIKGIVGLKKSHSDNYVDAYYDYARDEDINVVKKLTN